MSDLDLNAIREAAEGATQEWRISQHWDERGREAPNRISGIYEPIPGQKLGSRSCVMTANFKGAEPDDIWISINPQDRTYLEVTPPRAVLALLDRLQAAEAERDRLAGLLNTPETQDFHSGVLLEAGHQRERWGEAHDRNKAPEDWFWLVGYLAGKALAAAKSGDHEKALHHTISTAAALAHWHGHIKTGGYDPARWSDLEIALGLDRNAEAALEKETTDEG